MTQRVCPCDASLVDEMARQVDESVRLTFTLTATQRTTSCGTNLPPSTLRAVLGVSQARALHVMLSRANRTSRESEGSPEA